MAKSPTTRDFTEQTTESAMQIGSDGMGLMRMVAEQSLKLSKVAFEGYLTAARKAAESINHQASEIGQRSILFATEALSDTFDFANRVVRIKEPHEVLQLQNEFLSRKTQALADQTRELGQILAQGANAASRTAAGQMQRAAE
jgi:hypothetical protein